MIPGWDNSSRDGVAMMRPLTFLYSNQGREIDISNRVHDGGGVVCRVSGQGNSMTLLLQVVIVSSGLQKQLWLFSSAVMLHLLYYLLMRATCGQGGL